MIEFKRVIEDLVNDEKISIEWIKKIFKNIIKELEKNGEEKKK